MTEPAGPATLSLPTTVKVFDANAGPWLVNNGRWYSYQQSYSACESGVGFADNTLSPASCLVWLTDTFGTRGEWVRSQGPWWVDPNHQQLPGGNGFGLIHVLSFAQIPGALQGPLDLDGTTVRLRTRISADWVRPLAASSVGELPGRAYLWFQTYPRPVANCIPDPSIGENCTRQSDYIFTDGWQNTAALDQSSTVDGDSFSIALRADEASRWTCLGAGKNVKYDCLPFEQALQQVALMGVIFAPVRSCPIAAGAPLGATCDRSLLTTDPAAYFNPGRFDLRDFVISINAARSGVATRATLRSESGAKPALLWNPLRYLETQGFQEGDGVHLLIPRDMAAVRLGLSRSRSAVDFNSAGPQVYLSPVDNEPNQPNPTVYVQVPDANGGYSRVVSVASYVAGDRVSLLLWRDKVVVTKNDEVVHMTLSPCAGIADCRLNAFISTHLSSTHEPPVYLQ